MELFCVNPYAILVHIDVDKVYAQFLKALAGAGSLAIDRNRFEAAYQNCLKSGAITTILQENAVGFDPQVKSMIDQQSEDLQQRTFEMLKAEIFELSPASDPPTSPARSILSGVFGVPGVALKPQYAKRGVRFEYNFSLNTAIKVRDALDCDLTPLVAAIKADRGKYFVTEVDNTFGVENGDAFQKLSVMAANNVNFDGPIQAVQIEVSYPDFSNPTTADGKVSLITKADGFHYSPGHHDPTGPMTLARWTKDNPNDLIIFAFLKLDRVVAGWEPAKVLLRKKIVFSPGDPQVDLANGSNVFVSSEETTNHIPVINDDDLAHINIKFVPDRHLPRNVSVSLACKIGSRTDIVGITPDTKDAVWKLWSDKYTGVTQFQYQVTTTVAGPDFTDAPVKVCGNPVTVNLPAGRLKQATLLVNTLEHLTDQERTTIDDYLRRSQD
jgi:hypothetical protein